MKTNKEKFLSAKGCEQGPNPAKFSSWQWIDAGVVVVKEVDCRSGCELSNSKVGYLPEGAYRSQGGHWTPAGIETSGQVCRPVERPHTLYRNAARHELRKFNAQP